MSTHASQTQGALAGKVAILTGASSGIGYATAKLFANEGARLVVGARRRPQLDALVVCVKRAPHWSTAVPSSAASPPVTSAVPR